MGGIRRRLFKYLPENNRVERIWKLAQIDFMKRYYNDRLGLFWALLNPFFRIVVYYVVFKYIFHTREEKYILFLACGILLWGVFSEATNAGMSVLNHKLYLISNVQFDKLDLFISHAISVFMGFAFNLVVFIAVALALDAELSTRVFWLIPTLLTVFLLAVATTMLLATLLIHIDDVRHLWDMVLFLGFWASGVVHSMDEIVHDFPLVAYLNPFIGILKNARNALIYGLPPDYFQLIYSLSFSIVLFFLANWIFRRNEHLVLEKV